MFQRWNSRTSSTQSIITSDSFLVIGGQVFLSLDLYVLIGYTDGDLVLDDLTMQYNILITKGETMYIAKNIELWVVSQGETIEQALAHIQEATELFIS